MGEDVNSVSPTLGFIIKTIEYEGYGSTLWIILGFTDSDSDTSSISAGRHQAPNRPLLTVLGDVGGQKTLRSYWRNYFEKTDALIWVVDATDRLRIEDCREELHGLLQEEVCEMINMMRDAS